MTQPHLICIDIDGTLTVHGCNRPSERNLAALRAARQSGHRVCINTGRSFANLPPELTTIPDVFDGFICANGSYIRLEDICIRNRAFPEDLIYALLQYFFTQDDRFCLFEGEKLLLKTRDYSDLYGGPGTRIHAPEELFDRYKGLGVNVISCEGHLPQAFFDRFGTVLNIFQCETFADCTLPGCSKAVGLELTAAHYGIAPECTVAIGDSANDLPMLRKAGTAVVMGNGEEKVRAVADLVTDTNDHDGVAKALETLFPSIKNLYSKNA